MRNFVGHLTHPLKKFDDCSGMQFTTDSVKASLHNTKIKMQPEVGANTKMSKTETTDGVLVLTIGPNGK